MCGERHFIGRLIGNSRIYIYRRRGIRRENTEVSTPPSISRLLSSFVFYRPVAIIRRRSIVKLAKHLIVGFENINLAVFFIFRFNFIF